MGRAGHLPRELTDYLTPGGALLLWNVDYYRRVDMQNADYGNGI